MAGTWHLLLLQLIFVVCARGQNRLYSRLDDVETLIKDVRDQMQVENNMRTTQTVQFHLAIEKVQKQLESLSSKVTSLGSSGAPVPSDVHHRLRSLESALNTLQGDVSVKVDTSLEKLSEVESKTTTMKDEMDSKLRKVMNGINTIYDMNREMKSSMDSSSGRTSDLPGRDHPVDVGDRDTTINFLIETIEDTQRTMQERMDILKNQLGRKLEGLEVLTSSLMQQNEALIDEMGQMRQCVNSAEPSTPASYSRGGRKSWNNDTSDVAGRVLLELKVSQMEIKSDFSRMMREVENTMESVKQCRASGSERSQRRVPVAVDDERDLEAAASVQVSRKFEAGPAVQSIESGKCVTASHIMNPKNCAELRSGGANCDGMYIVYTHGVRAVRVYCDMTTDGGGWTVVMRRGNYTNLPLSFDHDWNGYKHGFGDIEREFWLGNDYIHMLSHEVPMELLITLESFDGEKADFRYNAFTVANEADNYRLRVGGYVGSNPRSGNSFRRHSNQVFSTADRNPVRHSNCAATHRAGWWFHSCMSVLLTGEYASERSAPSTKGIRWPSWKTVPLKFVEMKMRPKEYRIP